MTQQLELEEKRGQLTEPALIRRYILGGNATFTLRSLATGLRFTYKVKSATKDRGLNWSTGNQDRTLFFVSVLTGRDNDSDFSYIGILKQSVDGEFRFSHTAKSSALPGSPSFDGFAKCWKLLEFGCRWHPQIEFWHEGKCCVCGRKLTVPESVETGMGPECASKEGI